MEKERETYTQYIQRSSKSIRRKAGAACFKNLTGVFKKWRGENVAKTNVFFKNYAIDVVIRIIYLKINT